MCHTIFPVVPAPDTAKNASESFNLALNILRGIPNAVDTRKREKSLPHVRNYFVKSIQGKIILTHPS